jgi:hypothetical protein
MSAVVVLVQLEFAIDLRWAHGYYDIPFLPLFYIIIISSNPFFFFSLHPLAILYF